MRKRSWDGCVVGWVVDEVGEVLMNLNCWSV